MTLSARRLADGAPAAALFALMAAELALKAPVDGAAPATPAAYLWALAVTAPLAGHRRFPVAAVLVTGAAIVGYAAGHWSAFPGYPAFALVFLVSLRRDRGRGLIALAVQTAALLVAIGLQAAPTVTTSTWVTTVLTLVVAWLAGDNLRVRRERWTALQARARRLEADREERARQAVSAERLRIARELHDVVAHAMSVIAVQAGVANHVIDSRPELARQALATVETNTRAALVEMRRLLGVLRRPDEPSGSLAPAPGLADVPALVAHFAQAGLVVEVSGDDPPPDVPDGVDLSAYRIVQEGLTNVLRHGGPKATLRIGHRSGELRIEIGDDGPVTPRRGGEPGHGLIGMRQRVALYGGQLEAGPRDGGYAVRARLPIEPSA
jgi:signal transduction histidine kinase